MELEMRPTNHVLILLLSGIKICGAPSKQAEENTSDYVSIVQNDSLNKLEIFIDDKYFTSYMYAERILRKPVLFPVYTASEKRITRGFPIAPNQGERIDHPHHYGIWFNHVKFLKVESGETGILEVEKEWRNDLDELILREQHLYRW